MTQIPANIKGDFGRGNFQRILATLIALTLYLVFFEWYLTWLLPDEPASVTAAFIHKSWKPAAALMVAAHFVFLVVFRLGRCAGLVFQTPWQLPRIGDWFLILLPLTPVAQYILNNQNILSGAGSLFLLAVFAGFSALFIMAAPAVLGRIGPIRPLVFLGLAFTFTLTNMAALSASRHWFAEGRYGLQLAVFGSVFLVGWLLYERVGRRFTYLVVALYFVANSVTQFVTARQHESDSSQPDTNSKLIDLVGSREPLTKPNIYLLIYDAYVPNETMLGYGIDNSEQERYLEDQGFQLYPNTYSVAGFSVGTMSRVLNASSNFFGEPRSAVSGNGIVPTLLQRFGYETHGIFWSDYYFQTEGANYDYSFPRPSRTHLMVMKAIFMGEFRFDVEFENPSRKKFVAHKARIFSKKSDRPRFVYMHDDLPGHSQNSGECRPDETELFAARLERANAEMKRNLAIIQDHDPEALIIVAGDHGPYLTKNCYVTGGVFDLAEISRLDLQDRYGTFLAIKWPVGESAANDDIIVLQDVFPAIFASLFDDPGLLKARVRPSTTRPRSVSGASVLRGTIRGGIHDGEPLFLDRPEHP